MANKVVVYQSGGSIKQRWYWHVLADNGRVVTTSGEGYLTKWNAKRAVKKLFPELELVVK